VTDLTVELRPPARKNLRRLLPGVREAALQIIEELREQGPALVKAFHLRGYKDTWKVRFHHLPGLANQKTY
jgi:hypothetical protein